VAPNRHQPRLLVWNYSLGMTEGTPLNARIRRRLRETIERTTAIATILISHGTRHRVNLKLENKPRFASLHYAASLVVLTFSVPHVSQQNHPTGTSKPNVFTDPQDAPPQHFAERSDETA
jgi:hypothetical protein